MALDNGIQIYYLLSRSRMNLVYTAGGEKNDIPLVIFVSLVYSHLHHHLHGIRHDHNHTVAIFSKL